MTQSYGADDFSLANRFSLLDKKIKTQLTITLLISNNSYEIGTHSRGLLYNAVGIMEN